ncbi:MAG: tetratricopeptide repeat protein [Planctomycetota bacterium]|jgi:tetratricopeptide (TPR) repeat protein
MSLSVFLRRVLVSFCLPFLLLTTLMPASAQQALWMGLTAQAETLINQGRYAEGAKVAQEALKVAEDTFGPDHPVVGFSLVFLGQAYIGQGKYAEAEPLLKRALSIYEKALHPQVATTLEKMAYLYKKTGRWDEARRLEERAQAIRSRNQ